MSAPARRSHSAATASLISLLLALLPAGRVNALEPGPIPQWIWRDPHRLPDQRIWLTKTFTLESGAQVRTATLSGLADDRARVVLNGTQIAEIATSRKLMPADVTAHIVPGTNRIVVDAQNASGPAGLLLSLKLEFANGQVHVITTDPTWQVLPHAGGAVTEPEQLPAGGRAAYSLGLMGVFPWGNPEGETEDYYQWKKALGTGVAHDAAAIAIKPGFDVQLVRSSAPGEGSWVSITFDNRGRAIIGREGKGLLRYTLPPNEAMEVINETLEECRGVLFAHDSLYANANNSKALYRLLDTDGDDQFDQVKLLRSTPGGVGHGRNALALGPDGMIYAIHGNNVRLPEDYQPARSPLQHFAEDRLIPCEWDKFLFDPDAKVPAGHVVRTDPEGRTWELVAGGFRNPYGIDFNREGEMFTYDADNEGDIGTPWYRPTRINHIVPGGDYGFRHGTENREMLFAEHPPSNCEIGLGSPTGVKFGHHGNFPGRYGRALYALDWSYGRIYCIHLIEQGAGYVCQVEKLLEGQPLNVTDLAFGPDGALYFITGGRGTQSGLYRVAWSGDDRPAVSEEPALDAVSPTGSRTPFPLRQQRRELEATLGVNNPDSRHMALAALEQSASDPWMRHAARVALEFQSIDTWWNRGAEVNAAGETGLTLCLAAARVGDATLQPQILQLLQSNFHRAVWLTLGEDLRLDTLRVLAICFVRMGRPEPAVCEQWLQTLQRVWPREGSAEAKICSERLKQRLCELAVYFGAPWVVDEGLAFAERAELPEDQLRYLFALRTAKVGWRPETRRQYFELLKNLDHHTGGNLLPVALDLLRNEVLGSLGDEERKQLEAQFARDDSETLQAAEVLKSRAVVRKWAIKDLPELVGDAGRPDFETGERLFRQALCVRCHRVAGAGGAVGPELSKVANRFGPRDLLEMVLDPSKTIDEKYRQTQIETKAGKIIVGRLVGGDDKTVVLAPEALTPRQTVKIEKSEIESQSVSTTSPMPAGLLDTFSAAEIRDLMAYLQSGGRREHPVYQSR